VSAVTTTSDWGAINHWEPVLNLEALNRYVLVVIGLFAVLLYLVMVVAGFSELISHMLKPKGQRKRSKAVAGRLRSGKKSS
jgi:Na+-transporting methylmalonyl-CoA/oxaloacetate decarboxylase gamma subunit